MRNTDNKTTGGRPKSYDPNLVRKIIEASLAAGTPATDLDVHFVKKKLCEEHGVNESIRKESLQSLVDSTHAEIAEEKSKGLLKALPSGIGTAVDEAVAAAGRELLLIVARQHGKSQALADERCDELRADKRNAQHRIAELEGELAEEKEARETLGRARKQLADQLTEVQEELRVARSEVQRLSNDPNGIDRLLAALRDPDNRDGIRAALAEIVTGPPTHSNQ